MLESTHEINETIKCSICYQLIIASRYLNNLQPMQYFTFVYSRFISCVKKVVRYHHTRAHHTTSCSARLTSAQRPHADLSLALRKDGGLYACAGDVSPIEFRCWSERPCENSIGVLSVFTTWTSSGNLRKLPGDLSVKCI